MSKEQKYPVKDIDERMKRLELDPPEKYGFVENGFWYPNERFLEETHELVIREYGGHSGYEVGFDPLKIILEKTKATEGAFLKAAILLRDIITVRMYRDGNHRTALLTCETFLNENGKELWTENSQTLYMFIKEILNYSIDEIAEWLENGPKA